MTFAPVLPWIWYWVTLIGLLAIVIVGALGAPKSRRARWLVRLVGVACLCIAMSRPGVGDRAATLASDKLDVIFVVDVSPSIAALDWGNEQERLEGVREDIRALAEQHAGARVSVITFNSSAAQVQPLMRDRSALDHTLERLTPEDYWYTQGSSIYAAADTLQDVLRKSAEHYPDHARVVYYLGDGEQTSRDTYGSFSGSAELISGGAVLGYGTTEGARIPKYDDGEPTGRFIVDLYGEEGVSKADPAELEDIAGQLNVNVQLRSADEPVRAAEVTIDETEIDAEATIRVAYPLYWIFACGVCLWLLAETWWLTQGMRDLRRERAAAAILGGVEHE